ncbi:MAG: 4Fe-4S ferredoxin [Ruminococcaceae bacterium]|nr:4Fe-4S ferredoxin [Oscillospiraceae bacterium]
MKCYPHSDLTALFEALSQTAPLYLPTESDNGAVYTKYAAGVTYSASSNTRLSPKSFFFPQTEDLVKFRREGKSVSVIDERTEPEDFILFGVRACDAKSIDVLDRVFLSAPADSYYAARRDHVILMTMACTRPAQTCFCHAFGIDASDPGGDIACYRTEDALYLDGCTERGQVLLDACGAILEDCSDDHAAVTEQKQLIRARTERLPLASLTTDGFGADALDVLFDRPEWETLSESCLGCGTCTFVCPTCQCYDIRDFDTGHGICRYRCWDSCMYSEFTKMSAGQPRTTQMQRFRQRFLHKLVYFPANNDGMFGCVGCGRCLAACPIAMNITKVMNMLGGKEES